MNHLAGVGVAFYLLMALRKHLRTMDFWGSIEEPNLLDYCDLVALGTIGDMVPLKEENRILSIHGLNVIRKGKRIGLKTLADVRYLSPIFTILPTSLSSGSSFWRS